MKKSLNDMAILYPYQSEIIKIPDRFQIHKKSRQIGYSFTFAYKAVKRCIFQDRDQLILSASQRQSSRVMYYAEKFINAFMIMPECKGVKLEIDAKTEKRFNNGKQILTMPSNPDTTRGFPGDVILDEYALHKDDEKIFEAILPSITGGHGENKGYCIDILSSPMGMNNMFYKIYSDLDRFKSFYRNSVNIYDAIARSKGRFNPDIEAIKANYDEESFRQEFLCEFIDEATAYFTYELLKSCIDDYEPTQLKGKTFIGIDIGRTHDRTVIAVISELEERRRLKRLEVLFNIPFGEQRKTIKQIIQEENPQKVLIDKGAIGMQIAEELEHDYTFCEGIQINNIVKSDCATTARKFMEDKNFKFLDDENGHKLITEFHTIARKVSIQNNISFDSPRDNTGHGDKAWAVMLGLLASKEPTFEPQIRTLG